jgi:hypothetical protein
MFSNYNNINFQDTKHDELLEYKAQIVHVTTVCIIENLEFPPSSIIQEIHNPIYQLSLKYIIDKLAFNGDTKSKSVIIYLIFDTIRKIYSKTIKNIYYKKEQPAILSFKKLPGRKTNFW